MWYTSLDSSSAAWAASGGSQIVIRDLPPIIDSSVFQLESYIFQSGIYMPGTAVDWETNVDWANINYSGLMTAEQSGEFEITASLLSNPDIQTTVSCKVELPAGIHEFSNARIQIFPNPAGDHISILEANDARISIFSTRGEILMEKKNYSVEEKINVGELSPGIYLLRVSREKYSTTLKLIKR